MGQILRTVPFLASLNLKRTVHFYTEKLGFECVHQDDSLAILTRDTFSLHFWPCNEAHIAESTGCYINVDSVDDFYEEYMFEGVTKISPPENKPWGKREMYVYDLDGNLLRFGAFI